MLWTPGPTTDAGELVYVFAVFLASLAIMVALGAWWSR